MKNQKFKLFNTEWTIVYVDEIKREDDSFYFGLTDYVCKKIFIVTKDSNDNPLSENEIKRTLLHELMHAILITGCFEDCNTEPCVEWIANCLYSLLEQKIINDDKNIKKRRVENKRK